VVHAGATVVGIALGGLLAILGITPELVYLLILPLIIPSVAVQIRRFHDLGKSGWFILLGLIPFIGGLVIIYFMVQPSMAGENEYGPNPYDGVSFVP